MLSIPNRKTLWARAGGRCSRCKRHDSEVRLMEAHIVAQPGGPRSDDPLPLDQAREVRKLHLALPKLPLSYRWPRNRGDMARRATA